MRYVYKSESTYCKTGWPNKSLISSQLIPYWKERGVLTVCKGQLLFNSRIAVPKLLQQETLHKVHAGHLGIEKCKKRVAMSVWWPGVTQQVTQLVQNCQECAKQYRQGKEPLIMRNVRPKPAGFRYRPATSTKTG